MNQSATTMFFNHLPTFRLLLLMLLGWCNVSMATEQVLLSNAKIIDPLSENIRHGHLLLEGGFIAATLNDIPSDFSGRIIDIQGKWVIPGLNELHTHAFGNRAPGVDSESIGTPAVAERVLAMGVTSLLDLFADEDAIYNHRQRQQDGKFQGADIYTSLSCLTATKGHCTEYGIPTRVMDSPEEAITVVTSLAKRSPDVIKIVYDKLGRLPSISEDTLKAAIATANALGLKTIIHINTVDGMRDAVLAGASALTHLPNDKEIPESLAKLMVEHNVASIPTIVADTDLYEFINTPSVLNADMAQHATSQTIIGAYLDKSAFSESRLKKMEADNLMFQRSARTLIEAGVVMLTGSDAGGYGTIQGYSVHRELIKLVESGLSTWQALAASTTNAGTFLGKRYGVNPGDEANLVILNASPIEDISNTQKIEFVIHHGRVIDIK